MRHKKGSRKLLTATGAWYTAHAETSSAGNAGITVQLNDFITLTAAGDDSGDAIHVYTKLAGGDASEVSAVSGTYYVFPEDYITVADNTHYTVTLTEAAAQACDVWYVVSTNGGSTWGEVQHYVTGTANKVLVDFYTTAVVGGTNASDVSDEGSAGAHVYRVDTSLDTNAAGHTFTVSIAGGNIAVRAIQYNNITSAQAAYMLGAGWNSGAPTAKAAAQG